MITGAVSRVSTCSCLLLHSPRVSIPLHQMPSCRCPRSWFPILCFYWSLLHFSIPASAQDTSFSFTSFGSGSVSLLGDAFLRNGSIELTQDSIPGLSAGRALSPHPLRFLDKATNTTASFKTSFSFSVINQNPIHFGDGLAFIVVPNNVTLGGSGGWLGFLNSTGREDDKSHSFAVEFDTFMNVEFFDPNDNHVGVDVNSMRSIQFADAGSESVQLKSGAPINAWIEYDSARQELEVSMSYSEQKPQKRLLSLSINLWGIFDEYMFVGFSGATGGNIELHSIHSWSFSTSGLLLTQPVDDAPAASPQQQDPIAPAANAPTGHLLQPPAESKCRSQFCVATARFFGVSIGAAVAGAVVVSVLLWWFCHKWKQLKRCSSFRSASMVSGPRKFTYRELSLGTKGFSPSKILGHGAFGTVYKGHLQVDGNEIQVAVKRAEGSKQGKEEFMSELSIIGCLRHRNLVQLQGWCREKNELLLVYDFMPNGSLDKLLFNKKDTVLTWPIRFKVVVGVGTALAYLHSEWEQQVVHRDIKASNIMLDANFNARLGDFGLARLIEHDRSPETTITAGTLGYLAPEYLHTGKATEKTDVFSFGTVALEVATGRRPIEKDSPADEPVLVDWLWGLHKEGRLANAADPRLGQAYDQQEMILLLQVGLLCCHPDPTARPTMKQAVQILCGVTSIPPLPKFKPMPSFASIPPLSIQDIMSEQLSP